MPLFRRRPLLRAAAVGGGAYAYGKHRQREQEDQYDQAYQEGQQSMAPPAPAPQAAAPTSGGISDADVSRLQEIGKLHEQGVLTDDEFQRQKTLILGG